MADVWDIWVGNEPTSTFRDYTIVDFMDNIRHMQNEERLTDPENYKPMTENEILEKASELLEYMQNAEGIDEA